MPRQTTSSFADLNARASDRGAAPGVWPTVAMTVFSGALCLAWLMSAGTTATVPGADAMSSVSAIDEVADSDLDAALATMEGSASNLAEFKATAPGCRRKLAQITLTSATAEPGARIRPRSGAYHSPEFVLTATPVRVAQEPTGPGTMTLLAGHPGEATPPPARPEDIVR